MTVLDFLSGGLCKVVQEDRAKRKSRESAPTLSLAQQLRSKNARGGGMSQTEVSLHPRKGRINFPKMKPVSTDRALFHLSWKEFCHANKSVSCTVMDNF